MSDWIVADKPDPRYEGRLVRLTKDYVIGENALYKENKGLCIPAGTVAGPIDHSFTNSWNKGIVPVDFSHAGVGIDRWEYIPWDCFVIEPQDEFERRMAALRQV